MLATVGLIFAIALLVVMIIKGIDMITATVITAVIILLSSQLSLSDGLLTTFSGGAGGLRYFLVPDPGYGRHLRTAGAGDRAGYENCQMADAEAGSQDGGAGYPRSVPFLSLF